MSKVSFHDYTEEDHRKLMLKSSVADGESHHKPLMDTDQEKWNKKFDATYVDDSEEFTLVNMVVAIIGIILILVYHFL